MRRLLLLVVVFAACSKPAAPPAPVDAKWSAEVQRFRETRAKVIGGPNGWITLISRVTLKSGVNTIGSDPKATAVLPADRAPPLLGTLNLEAGTLYFSAAPGVEVKVGGAPVATLTLADDSTGKATVLEHGSLKLHVLRRGDLFVLRVKDSQHPARAGFKGLEWFPSDPAWRVRARLEPSPEGATLPILNVLNQTENQKTPGHLVFTVDGTEYRLAALKEDEPGFFIIFKDKTAGEGTYPSGRFINTPAPDAEGFVDLDFNRAYSPPCAFTSFATCPIPPKENHLAMKVNAGEKYAGAH